MAIARIDPRDRQRGEYVPLLRGGDELAGRVDHAGGAQTHPATDGVRGDINAVLNHVPERPVYVVFHDSFHPPSREGILQADWQQCPYVHFVEVDFIPGVFHYHAFDTAEPRSMYGGLAVALMLPEKRESALAIHESQRGLFDTVLQHSCHVPPRQQEVELLTRIRKKLGSVKRRLIGR